MSRTTQQRIDAWWSTRAPSYAASQAARADGELGDREVWSRVWAGALPEAPSDVLDVGTGSGAVACVVASLGHRVTGIDSAEGMLATARRHALAEEHPPTILAGDMVDPDFPDASFDVVCGRYVTWTLREPLAALAAWRRVLRPGGRVAVVDATWFPAGVAADGDAAAMREWYDDAVLADLPLAEATSIEQTAEVMRAAGLVEVRVEPLTELLALDLVRGAAPGHLVRTQYLLTGTSPG